MNTSALILMIITQLSVTLVTIYFFIRVLTSKPEKEPDSYSEE